MRLSGKQSCVGSGCAIDWFSYTRRETWKFPVMIRSEEYCELDDESSWQLFNWCCCLYNFIRVFVLEGASRKAGQVFRGSDNMVINDDIQLNKLKTPQWLDNF